MSSRQSPRSRVAPRVKARIHCSAWNPITTVKSGGAAAKLGMEMQRSLEEELKAFEQELSLLLVRFMKICDAVEKQGSPKPAVQTVAQPARPMPHAAPRPVDLRAYS
jgi:hypothetical protein